MNHKKGNGGPLGRDYDEGDDENKPAKQGT